MNALNEVPGDESRQSACQDIVLPFTVEPSMKCREMNPGNGVEGWYETPDLALNEVPGDESRQYRCHCTHGSWSAALNEVPGDESRQFATIRIASGMVTPSMKCREMNPGNSGRGRSNRSRPGSLNEVPGDESRQFQGRHHRQTHRRRPSMKCREMNPGNGHILTHTISRAAIEKCERSNISHPFSRIIQDTNAEKDIE